MKRLINSTLALALATLLSPAVALETGPSVAGDASSQLLDRELDRLGWRQPLLGDSANDLDSAGPWSPRRELTMLASSKHKDRDHKHYRRYKGERHYRKGHDHHHHHHRRDRYDHGHVHYYRPLRYWDHDRYYGYYDGVNLNLILHLD